MPGRTEEFDIDVLLDAPDPITPLPIDQRVQRVPVRPYYNIDYLAHFVEGATAETRPGNERPDYTFTCPFCSGPAKISSGFTATKPFIIACEGLCSDDALRAKLHELAPAAFEQRDDILYPFPNELAQNLRAAGLEGKAMPLAADERWKLRKFREATSDISVAVYDDPRGKPLMMVFRGELAQGKTFLPAHAAVDVSDVASVVFGYPPGPWPIFNWGNLVARPEDPVLVVEGEKTALHAAKLLPKYVVVTSAAGSSNAALSDWSPLHDRDVVIWRDNDAAGMKYARSVAALALGVRARSVRSVVLPADLPDKWDLADDLPCDLTLDKVRHCLDQAPPISWDEVKTALERPADGARPPFRLPDGIFAGHKQVTDAVEQALQQLDPGCNRSRWMAMLTAIHHALGEQGFALADAWSQREADRHGKYQEGEVRRIFDTFAVSPPASPLPLLTLFRAAMKEARAESIGDDAEDAWSPPATALTLAYIADFEETHRKVTQGDNVMIAIQSKRGDGSYGIEHKQERNAASLYMSRKAPDFKGKRANLFTLWQNNQLVPPLKLVFKPGGDVAPDELNTFQGLDIKPAQGGSYARFREHADAIMAANGDTDGYLLKLMAYRLQNLTTYVPAMLVMIGREGSGKSTFTSVLARLLSPYSIAFSDPDKFVGRNNAELQGKLFVQLEEMILGRREEYDSRVKHYITSPTLDVEQKFKATWQIPNHLFVAMTANKASAVRVTEHSRRFAMYEVEDRFGGDQAARESFFGQLWAELDMGGLEALAHDLMELDLTGFSPAQVPKTKLFLELAGVDADRDPLRGWWHEALETGVLCESDGRQAAWTDPVQKDTLYRRYAAWCENDGPKSRGALRSKAEWAKALGKMLPGGLPATRKMVGRIRGHYLELPSYEECCSYFEGLYGTTIERSVEPGQLKSVM